MKKKSPNLDLAHAQALLSRPGHRLQEIKTARKSEFVIAPGGPVTEAVARKLLEHPRCCEVDPGLLPGISQTWSLCGPRKKKTTTSVNQG
jgi:hypothetical protein